MPLSQFASTAELERLEESLASAQGDQQLEWKVALAWQLRQRDCARARDLCMQALDLLSKRDVVELDNDRKAAMVSNLLVVLCGDRNTQPVVNTGTIYQ